MFKRILPYLIIIALAVLNYYLYDKWRDALTYQDAIEALEQELSTWQDSAGHWKAEARVAALDLKTANELFEGKIKKLEKEVKASKVKQVEYVELITRDTVYAGSLSDIWNWVKEEKVWTWDTSSIDRQFTYKDEWASMTIDVKPHGINLDYTVRDSLQFTTFTRNGLFKRKRTFLQGKSFNPHTKITGIEAIRIEDKVQRFGIGPQIGITYDGEFKPYWGIGVQWSLVRF